MELATDHGGGLLKGAEPSRRYIQAWRLVESVTDP
jgi:hypothetical protein